MKISEIFYSIQGEGLLSGVPSVFVRTQGCNLRCSWCDTGYARDSGAGVELSVPDVLKRVLEHNVCRHCVITGGEPMLQAYEVKELAATLRASGKHVTIETNATVQPDGVTCDLGSLSPKLLDITPDSDGSGCDACAGREKLAVVLKEWIETFPFQLKFVVRDEADIINVSDIVGTLGLNPRDNRLFLMPLSAVSGADDMKIAGTVVELCKRHGYRYCHRIHRSLYGDCAGV